MSDSLKKQKASRTANRGVATKILGDAKTHVEKQDVLKATIALETLKRKLTQLENIDAQLLELLESDEDITSHVMEGETYLSGLFGEIMTYSKSIEKLTKTESTPKRYTSDIQKSTLPKLQLPKFDGNILNWQTFWGLFDAAVHSSSSFSDVEKFAYLKCQLLGEAKGCIDGLPLTEENYRTAIKLLKQRFGQSQKIEQGYLRALLEISPPSNDHVSLRHFYDQTESYIRHLESVGRSPSSYGSLLVPIMLEKLPLNFRRTIARSCNKLHSDWSLDELRCAILEELQIFESCDKFNEVSSSKLACDADVTSLLTNAKSVNPRKTYQSQRFSREKRKFCIFCTNSAHFSSDCPTVTDIQQRLKLVREARRCFNCLGDHLVKDCKSSGRCRFCSKKHHSSLCFTREKTHQLRTQGIISPTPEIKPSNYGNIVLPESRDAPGDSTIITQTEPKQPTLSVNHYNCTDSSVYESSNNHSVQASSVLLKTAVARIAGQNESKICNILFDDGSQRTFVSRKVVDSLDLEIYARYSLKVSAFSSNSQIRYFDVVDIRVHCIDGSTVTIQALVIDEITEPLLVPASTVEIPEFKGLTLAHSIDHSENFEVELLIGADFYYQFICDEIIRTKSGPIALKSKLGYLIAGPVDLSLFHSINVLINLTSQPDSSDFWSLESIGIMPECTHDSDQKFLDNYCSNYIDKERDNRYQAKFPWREDHPPLPTNYNAVTNRTRGTLQRLARTPDMLRVYSNIISDQLEKGFIEKVSDSELSNLNDCLDSGPSLLNELTSILLRFRFFDVGLAADIEKAFLQIGLHPKDRDATRFFWLSNADDANSKFEIYRFKRVLFGATSSPFILNSTVLHHLKQNRNETSSNLSKNIYVDNVLTSVPSEADAKTYYTQSRKILADGRFNLRSWSSNSEETRKLAGIDGVLENSLTIDSLGIRWDTDRDTLSLKPKFIDADVPLTKRVVIQNLSKIYDPLGLITPLTIKAKIFAQNLWRQNFDWDTPLPSDLCQQWKQIASELNVVSDFHIPRCYFHNRDSNRIELHTFADASKMA
ncbi:uncharacterized protein LOC141907762 [Tubulanus polymorphus]|uniref:uncharacterized protein LOC141907762 n=1 Tax=Tubulanus polymorphus TaxID=672921 RepID=UPI003DA2DAC3